jgi:hypothetical protein
MVFTLDGRVWSSHWREQVIANQVQAYFEGAEKLRPERLQFHLLDYQVSYFRADVNYC